MISVCNNTLLGVPCKPHCLRFHVCNIVRNACVCVCLSHFGSAVWEAVMGCVENRTDSNDLIFKLTGATWCQNRLKYTRINP